MNELDLFTAAIAIHDSAEREALLDRECAGRAELRQRLNRLLEAHVQSQPMLDQPDRGPLNGEVTAAHVPPPSLVGMIIAGRYKLLEEIGVGGMGTVWVAEQTEPVKRKVALKLIKAGMDSKSVLARFEAERQALAVMDHPNIAKVLDGGLTDTGRPFFVMEYVKGLPITEYCDATRLSVPERLNLFVQVCSAVQHAHQKGIIHRDLKPSNILVAPYDDKPVPKVIDFGLAKAMHHSLTEKTLHTAHETVLGTPLYMSPEQAQLNNLDVDTRSDIYSLGVLLYELLTGTTPLEKKRFKEAAWDEIKRIIREEEAPRPSTRLSSSNTLASLAAGRQIEPARLTKLVRGELDWIVMKSLEKDRTRRYDTANGFAMDVQRYLAGEPVMAVPPSATYRLRKFVKRNKPQVVAGGLTLLALVGGIAGTTIGLVRAERARDAEANQRSVAQENEAKALAAAEAEKKARDRESTQRTRAERARDRTRAALDAMTSNFAGDALVKQREISAEQKKFLSEVLTYYKEFASETPDDERSRVRAAEAAINVGVIELQLGRMAEQFAAFRMARDAFAKLAAEHPENIEFQSGLARGHLLVSGSLEEGENRDEAKQEARKGISILDRLVSKYPKEADHRFKLASAYVAIAALELKDGNRADAEVLFRKRRELLERLVADFPNETQYRGELADSYAELADSLRTQNKVEEAVTQLQRAIAHRESLPPDSVAGRGNRTGLADYHQSLGFLLRALRKHDEAERHYRLSIQVGEKEATDSPSIPAYRADLAISHGGLANLLSEIGKRAEAHEHFLKAIAIEERIIADFPNVPNYLSSLGGHYREFGVFIRDGGQPLESLACFAKAIDKLGTLYQKDPHWVLVKEFLQDAYSDRATAYDRLEKYAEAAKDWAKVIEFFADDKHWYDRRALATSLYLDGRKSDGDTAAKSFIEYWEVQVKKDPSNKESAYGLAQAVLHVGGMYLFTRRFAETEEWSVRATKLWTDFYKRWPDTPETEKELRWCYWHRAVALSALNRPAEAIEEMDRSLPYTPDTEKPDSQMIRARFVAKMGNHKAATDRVTELLRNPPKGEPSRWFYWDAAIAYALASRAAKDDPTLQTKYADKSIDLIKRSIDAGFDHLALARSDVDVDPIRNRDDFKKIMADLERKVRGGESASPESKAKK